MICKYNNITHLIFLVLIVGNISESEIISSRSTSSSNLPLVIKSNTKGTWSFDTMTRKIHTDVPTMIISDKSELLAQSDASSFAIAFNSTFPWVIVLTFAISFLKIYENFSFIDSIYYCIITFTTIGFGDINTKTRTGKWVMNLLSLLGLSLHAKLLNDIGTSMKHRLNLGLITNFVLCTFTGLIVFSYLENWEMEKSLQFVFEMSSTIGYGSLSPTSSFGKLFCCVYSFWSLYTFSEIMVAISNILERIFNRENQKKYK